MTLRTLSRQCGAALLSAGMLALPPAAHAELIGTQQIARQAAAPGGVSDAHARRILAQFLARSDVRARLQHLGVGEALAQQRVAALSDAEVDRLASRIGSLPAAGSLGYQETVILLLVAILVVLVA